MARSIKTYLTKTDPLLSGVSGKIGGFVIRQTRYGTVISSAPRKSNRKPDERQMALRNRFADAAEYARRQLQNFTAKEAYQSKTNAKLRSPYVVAVKDYLSPPQILKLDVGKYYGKPGNPIIIDAEDDFKVNVVSVTIKDGSGKTIERGQATRRISYMDQWIYLATVKNDLLRGSSISVCAEDIPGNQATETAMISEPVQ